MSRTKFGSAAGQLTKWVPVGEIDVDPAVQRPPNKAWAAYIGRELDPDLIGVIHVSKRRNGRYVVIDGQHRVIGVRDHFGNNGTLIECKIYEGLSIAQEAAIFVGLNKKKQKSRISDFISRVTARDPHAVAIAGVLDEFGLKVDRFKSLSTVPAVSALESIYFGFSQASDLTLTTADRATLANPDLLRLTLRVVREAWGSPDAVNGHILSGVGRLLAVRRQELDTDDLIHKLAGYPGGPMGMLGAARGRRAISGGVLGGHVAEVCLDLYNKGRRTKVAGLR